MSDTPTWTEPDEYGVRHCVECGCAIEGNHHSAACIDKRMAEGYADPERAAAQQDAVGGTTIGIAISRILLRVSTHSSPNDFHEADVADIRAYIVTLEARLAKSEKQAALANANERASSGALIDPTCHHYEGIKCFHTKDCSIDKKRERCPFDDHQSGTLVEAPTCEVCGGSGDGKPFNEVFMDGKSPRKSPCIHCRGTGYEPMVPLSKFGNAEYHALAGLMDGKTPNDEIIRRLRAESVPLSSAEALHDAVQPILSGDLKPSEYRGIGQTIVAYSVPASCIGAILAADYKYRALGGE